MTNEWIDVSFKEICYNKNVTTKNPNEVGIERYIGLEHLKPEELEIESWGFTSEGTTFTRTFSPGQVLFGKRRSYQKKAAIAPFTGVCSGDILVFEANEDLIIPELLPYVVQNENFFDFAVGTSSGSLSPRTSWKHLSEYQLRLPSNKKTQKQILSQLLKLENAVGTKKKLLNATKLYQRKITQHLLTKGISHTQYKQTELGEIPIEWEVKSIEEIVLDEKNSIKIGPFGSQLKKTYLVHNGFKVYGQENVFVNDFSLGDRFINEEKYKQLKSCELKEGDVVITMMGTIGKCAIVPSGIEKGIMDSHLLRLRLNPEIYLSSLFIYTINSDLVQKQIQRLSVGGIMAGLSSTIIRKLKFPVPAIREQQEIANLLLKIEKQIEQYEKEYTNLKGIKKAFLRQLF